MTYLTLPSDEPRRLSFYLAMEEFAARQLRFEDDVFFMWQVEPTVIFGRNQVIENEVNLDYCREHGIQFYRRKSGGGCVYADHSNVMISYITRSDEVVTTFSRYMQMLTAMLSDLGLPATSTQNNDVLIDGRKVSGNAFYHLPGYSIVHGTLLYDTDMEHMLHAITPPQTKLDKHGVQSVRQRITLLKDYTTLPLAELKTYIRDRLCDRTYSLSRTDVEAISDIEQEYLNPSFIYGKANNS
ncbi:MAG: lipoate--protein ligase family protein [Bacteroidaceae bacterium]|nr:lipoate--protein ligase family protein [Bacteroidaceae bacterium]